MRDASAGETEMLEGLHVTLDYIDDAEGVLQQFAR